MEHTREQSSEPVILTDEQTMWRVRNSGDADAFALLIRRWSGPLLRACQRLLGDNHLAQDAVQETFSRVYARRGQYEPTARFSSYLWRIAINLCRDELRRRRRSPEADAVTGQSDDSNSAETWLERCVDPGSQPDHWIETQEQAASVQSALQSLPPHYREVIVLRHYQDLKFHEIAEILHIPLGTVKSRMAEGLTRLARTLPHPNESGDQVMQNPSLRSTPRMNKPVD